MIITVNLTLPFSILILKELIVTSLLFWNSDEIVSKYNKPIASFAMKCQVQPMPCQFLSVSVLKMETNCRYYCQTGFSRRPRH